MLTNNSKVNSILLFIILGAIIGFVGEFTVGFLWNQVFGKDLWIYPDSPFKYTSLESVPLWIAGFFVYLSAYKMVRTF